MAKNRSLFFYPILFVAIIGPNLLLAEPGASPKLKWAMSTPLPEARAGYAAGLVGGKLVIAGGTYWEGTKDHWIKKIFCGTTHAFDPVSETWEKLPDAPIPFGYAADVVVADKLFVLGGYTGSRTSRKILVLEEKRDRYMWSVLGDLPADRLFARALSVGNNLYLLGGTREFEPYDEAGTCCTSNTASKVLMALDTTDPKKVWRRLPPHPGAKRWLFSTETDGE